MEFSYLLLFLSRKTGVFCMKPFLLSVSLLIDILWLACFIFHYITKWSVSWMLLQLMQDWLLHCTHRVLFSEFRRFLHIINLPCVELLGPQNILLWVHYIWNLNALPTGSRTSEKTHACLSGCNAWFETLSCSTAAWKLVTESLCLTLHQNKMKMIWKIKWSNGILWFPIQDRQIFS